MAKREPVRGHCLHCRRDDVLLARWSPGREKCTACATYETRNGVPRPVAYPGETVDIRAPRRDGTIRVIKADANTVLKNTQNKNKSLAMHTQKYKNRIEELEDIIEAQKKRIRRLKRRNAELEALIGTEEE